MSGSVGLCTGEMTVEFEASCGRRKRHSDRASGRSCRVLWKSRPGIGGGLRKFARDSRSFLDVGRLKIILCLEQAGNATERKPRLDREMQNDQP